MFKILIFIFLFSLVLCIDSNGDFLNENPIHPIPQEMTFVEYQDMNRRISTGLLLSAIPIPGTIHEYAGEIKTAKKLRWVALGGIASILFGLSSSINGNWEESPYEIYILNEGQDNEIRYEMIPTGSIGNSQTYNYVELNKISGDIICPYPPGIPLLVPGEKIDIDRFNWIKNQSLCNKDLLNFNIRIIKT